MTNCPACSSKGTVKATDAEVHGTEKKDRVQCSKCDVLFYADDKNLTAEVVV